MLDTKPEFEWYSSSLPSDCSFKSVRKGFWFADTCACSLYLSKKTLLIFPNAK